MSLLLTQTARGQKEKYTPFMGREREKQIMNLNADISSAIYVCLDVIIYIFLKH